MATVTLPADKFDTTMVFTRPENPPARVPLDKLAVLPGFNTRVKDAEYNERVANITGSIVEHGYYEDKPLAVTMLPNDETVYVFDGEHRFDASKAAVLEGADFGEGIPVAWAKDGATVRDLTLHLLHGNNSERLSMVEMASVVRRLQGLGLSKDEIAKEIGRTTRHVDNLFVLADSNQQVRKAVASGQIAGAEAVKLLRKDKTTAAAKIADAVKAAAEKGKAKATPKTMAGGTAAATPAVKTKTVPFELTIAPGAKLSDQLKEMAGCIRSVIQTDADDKVADAATLRFSVVTIDHEAIAAAAEKQKAKEEAAAARLKAREDAAAEKAKQKEAGAAAKAADKEAKAKATADLLKESVQGAAKAGAAKAAASKGKTAAATKTAKAPAKPKGSDSKAKATEVAAEAPKAADGAETPTPAPLDDASMGGL